MKYVGDDMTIKVNDEDVTASDLVSLSLISWLILAKTFIYA